MLDKVQRALKFIRGRKIAYQQSLTSPAGQIVLADLANFCRASEDTIAPDPYDTARLNGRREVWLRIQHHLGLSPEQLMGLYTDFVLNPAGEDNDGR